MTVAVTALTPPPGDERKVVDVDFTPSLKVDESNKVTRLLLARFSPIPKPRYPAYGNMGDLRVVVKYVVRSEGSLLCVFGFRGGGVDGVVVNHLAGHDPVSALGGRGS